MATTTPASSPLQGEALEEGGVKGEAPVVGPARWTGSRCLGRAGRHRRGRRRGRVGDRRGVVGEGWEVEVGEGEVSIGVEEEVGVGEAQKRLRMGPPVVPSHTSAAGGRHRSCQLEARVHGGQREVYAGGGGSTWSRAGRRCAVCVYVCAIAAGCALHAQSRADYTIKCRTHEDYHRARSVATLQFNGHLALLVLAGAATYAAVISRGNGSPPSGYRMLGKEVQMEGMPLTSQFTLDSDEEKEDEGIATAEPPVASGVNSHRQISEQTPDDPK